MAYSALNSLQKILKTILSASDYADKHLELPSCILYLIVLVTILLLHSLRDFFSDMLSNPNDILRF